MTDGKSEALESQKEQQMATATERPNMSKKNRNKLIAWDIDAWLNDLGVRSLSFYERGVWFDMLCLMNKSPVPGRLFVGDRPMSGQEIARALGMSVEEFNAVVRGLLAANVCSQDERGLFCRRIVRATEGVDKRKLLDASIKHGKPVMQFPVVGGDPGDVWVLYEGQVKSWGMAYPNLNVEESCRQALAWIGADPKRRKTVGGMPKFLVAWFARQTDSGRKPVTGKSEKGSIEKLDLE